jgi:hypothetical protein
MYCDTTRVFDEASRADKPAAARVEAAVEEEEEEEDAEALGAGSAADKVA